MAAYGTDSYVGAPNSDTTNAFGMTTEDRLRDIQDREAKARDLELELDEKEKEMKKQYKGYRPPPNWPIARCAFARHDIGKDIPSRYQNHVRKFYSLWWLVVLATSLNWLSMIWYMSAEDKTSFMSYVLLPTLYVAVGCPFAWMFWYKRYYRAMQNNGNLSYMFFVFFGLQILWSGVMAIGFTDIGSCGVLVTLQTWTSANNVGLSMVMSVASVLWGLSCAVGMYMLKLAHFDLGRFLAQKYAAPMVAGPNGNPQTSKGSLNNAGPSNQNTTW